jgi:hypothetical protein
MNTKIIILSLLAVIAAIVAYCIVKSVKKEKLKRQYFNYTTISVFDKSEEYVKVEFYSQSPVEPYFDSDNNNVIISVEMSVKDFYNPANAYVYYKLDKSGAIVDYLAVEDYQNVDGYLVGKDNYISWLIDGDKVKKPLMDIADKLDKEKYPEKGNSPNDRQRMKSQTFPSHFRERQFNELKTENFHPVFFIRDEYHRGRPALVMGDVGRPNYWSGYGNFHLVLKKETLKLCLWMDEIIENNRSYHYYVKPGFTLFYDENVDFYILQAGSTCFYLIKPVNH